MSRTLNCIVAVCPNMGIGNDGNLPWHPKRLSKEFKHFQKMTMTPTVDGKQNVVIMGRKTWFSIPERNRPLKNRINIVLSRELKVPPAGAHHLASDFSSALHLLDTTELAGQADQVWVIGGSSLYKVKPCPCLRETINYAHTFSFLPPVSMETSPLKDTEMTFCLSPPEAMEAPCLRRLFVTRVQQQFDCDTFLPQICLDKYSLLPSFPEVPKGVQEENGLQYQFEVYESVQNEQD